MESHAVFSLTTQGLQKDQQDNLLQTLVNTKDGIIGDVKNFLKSIWYNVESWWEFFVRAMKGVTFESIMKRTKEVIVQLAICFKRAASSAYEKCKKIIKCVIKYVKVKLEPYAGAVAVGAGGLAGGAVGTAGALWLASATVLCPPLVAVGVVGSAVGAIFGHIVYNQKSADSRFEQELEELFNAEQETPLPPGPIPLSREHQE